MTDETEDRRTQAEDERKVMQTIEEYIFQNHRFPSKSMVAGLSQIPAKKCDIIVNKLMEMNQLYSVFGGGKGFPEVVLPYDMMQGVIMTQKKPSWLQQNYQFQEKSEIESKIQALNKDFVQYDMFERLLYRTDIPLEEAVAFTLEWLGFRKVEHHVKNKEYADVTFEYDQIKALAEVEGTAGQCDKKKVLQLDGWFKVEIEKGEKDPSQLQGFIIVNHFREDDPETRSSPLTDQAKKFLMRYNFRLLTTYVLYKIVRDVKEGRLSKEEAQKKIWEGEKIQ